MRGALAARRLDLDLAAATVGASIFWAGPVGTFAVAAAEARAGWDRTEPGVAAAYVVESAEMLRAAIPSTHRVWRVALAGGRFGRFIELTFGRDAMISVSARFCGPVSRESRGILGPVGRESRGILGPVGSAQCETAAT
jgi:hypothetical protein